MGKVRRFYFMRLKREILKLRRFYFRKVGIKICTKFVFQEAEERNGESEFSFILGSRREKYVESETFLFQERNGESE